MKKYLSLKTGKASKIGQRSQGVIYYRILTDQNRQQLYLIITGNDDDGYYSKEIIPFEKIERCLQDIKPNVPLSSKLFKPAFIGQSNNNSAFLAAILREEKLLAAVVDAVRKHSIQSGWDQWKIGMLKDAAQAKPYEPEQGKSKPVIKKASDATGGDNSELDSAVSEDEEPVKSKRPKKS